MWLAQREHSRVELRRKLLRVARNEIAEGQALAGERPSPEPALQMTPSKDDPAEAADSGDSAQCVERDPAYCVDRLLDWLQAHGYLSEARFVESRVHARAGQYGNLRIRQELQQHGVELNAETLQHLRDSELQRAREVWGRKFGEPPADAQARARQLRFLAQRGFSAEVVRRVVRGGEEEAAEE